MNDLISRQSAIDVEGLDEQIRCEMCRNPMHTNRGCDGNCKYDEKLYERIMQILGERIKPLPSAEPRKKGKWIPHKSIFGGLDEKVYICNQCGCNIGFHIENFCPNCGSYNGGEEEMSRSSFSKAYEEIANFKPTEMTFTIEDADLDKLHDVLKDINVKECPWFEVQDKYGVKAKYYREPRWIPCSEYPKYDFEDVLIRWHDKRKSCEYDYILCEGYVVRKHWCCIFEDADMSDYEPVEWQPLSSSYLEEGEEGDSV